MDINAIIANIWTDESVVVELSPLEASFLMATLFYIKDERLWDDYATDGDLIDALISNLMAGIIS